MIRPDDWAFFLDWLKRHWGLSIRETQFPALHRFLADKLDISRLTMEQYCRVVGSVEQEKADLLDAVTVGETYFFRDEGQFELLRLRLLPEFRATHRTMPRLWSAACSTGEEALSLLVVLAEAWGTNPEGCRNQVWASDINPRVLETLASGTFRPSSFREDGQSFHHLFQSFVTRTASSVQMSRGLVDLVPRRQINLVTDSLEAIPGEFDFIFLRNMMLYVTLEERPAIYQKVVRKLAPEGILVLGKAETPFFQEDSMNLKEIDGSFVFVKKSAREGSREPRRTGWPIST